MKETDAGPSSIQPPIAVLKSLWTRQRGGHWGVTDLKSIALKPQSGFDPREFALTPLRRRPRRCLGQNVFQSSHATLAFGRHGEDFGETPHSDVIRLSEPSSKAREGATTPSSNVLSGRTRARTRIPMSTPSR